ncbi:hypothetical protein [Paenimyroides aestuarii]|uniref:TonB C-terminal domain-containing protein n=1 Tax=Paenimyroides aestuarii TaxID=2968490 RepID=A0ABY5NU93_9FLAO|nr:hypothetical protein [Paenimyroides aestuarii]UUV22162.1 hypothetical protein NPX36_03760 [Paenimyroides aestuarii]
MRNLCLLILLLFNNLSAFAQDTLVLPYKPIVKDAHYAGGNTEDLYYYVNNNFNYNNVKKEDIPAAAKNKPYFVFYVVFAVSEDGKAFEFSPKEILAENSFYKEAVRVIASTRWNVATKDNEYKKQFMVIPIKANIGDF